MNKIDPVFDGVRLFKDCEGDVNEWLSRIHADRKHIAVELLFAYKSRREHEDLWSYIQRAWPTPPSKASIELELAKEREMMRQIEADLRENIRGRDI